MDIFEDYLKRYPDVAAEMGKEGTPLFGLSPEDAVLHHYTGAGKKEGRDLINPDIWKSLQGQNTSASFDIPKDVYPESSQTSTSKTGVDWEGNPLMQNLLTDLTKRVGSMDTDIEKFGKLANTKRAVLNSGAVSFLNKRVYGAGNVRRSHGRNGISEYD